MVVAVALFADCASGWAPPMARRGGRETFVSVRPPPLARVHDDSSLGPLLRNQSRRWSRIFSSPSAVQEEDTLKNADADEAPTSQQQAPAYGLYEVQEELITKRGQYEETIMTNTSPLLENKPKGAGSAGGFGGGGASSSRSAKPNKASLKAQGKEHAKMLRRDGVVRIGNVLSDEIADEMRDYVMQLRETATNEVQSEAVPQRQRFADVLLRKNRCDLTLPLCDTVYQALHQALVTSPVGATLQNLLTPNCDLYELSCLISDPGSDRQVTHPDTPCKESNEQAVLYTCFIALQDVTIDMGPTVWLPQTHTLEMHQRFQDETADGDSDSPKDHLLKTQPAVLGLLPKGSCAIFDSRCLHCGTANRSEQSRALFYFSFKHPSVGYPGNPASIRPELSNQLHLKTLTKEVETTVVKKKESRILQDLAETLR